MNRLLSIEKILGEIKNRYHYRLYMDELNKDIGTYASGNWGHHGLKGQIGGSSKGGGISNRGNKLEDGTYTSVAKQRRLTEKARKEAGLSGISKPPEQKTDPKEERRAVWKKEVARRRAEMLEKPENERALFIRDSGLLPQQEVIKQWHSGNINEYVNRYFDILEVNGDPTPTKRTVTGPRSKGVVRDWDKFRNETQPGWVQEDAGVSLDEAKEITAQIKTWTSNRWKDADTKTLDSYIEKAPAYSGKMYRGMFFWKTEDFDKFMEEVSTGTIRMKSNSSWSTDQTVSKRFSHMDDDVDSVEIRCLANRTATPIEHLSGNPGEDEVLAHSRTQWTVLRVDQFDGNYGGKKAIVYVMEKEDYADE